MNKRNAMVQHQQVLVLVTNVNNTEEAGRVLSVLALRNGIERATIDLEDRERILRLECRSFVTISEVKQQMQAFGFDCSELTH